jgi:hypothetical protein
MTDPQSPYWAATWLTDDFGDEIELCGALDHAFARALDFRESDSEI